VKTLSIISGLNDLTGNVGVLGIWDLTISKGGDIALLISMGIRYKIFFIN